MPARFIFSFALFTIISSEDSMLARILSMRSLVVFIGSSKRICLQSRNRQPNKERQQKTNNARRDMPGCKSALYGNFLVKNSANSILFHRIFLLSLYWTLKPYRPCQSLLRSLARFLLQQLLALLGQRQHLPLR